MAHFILHLLALGDVADDAGESGDRPGLVDERSQGDFTHDLADRVRGAAFPAHGLAFPNRLPAFVAHAGIGSSRQNVLDPLANHLFPCETGHLQKGGADAKKPVAVVGLDVEKEQAIRDTLKDQREVLLLDIDPLQQEGGEAQIARTVDIMKKVANIRLSIALPLPCRID